MKLSTVFTALGFGSAFIMIWLLLFGFIQVGFWLGLGAFVFFIILGIGGSLAESFQHNMKAKK